MISEYKKILKSSKFLYLWFSQIFSQVTINVLNFLILSRLFKLTGSTLATSFLWISYALPAILVGPIAAASVDMVSRRSLLIITNLLQSVTVFLFALTPEYKLFLPYGVAFIYSFLNQFYVPAEAASLPSVVTKKKLPLANSLFFFTQQGSIIVGYGFAGILNSFLGFKTTLFLSAFLLFLAFISVIFLPEIRAKNLIALDFEKIIFRFLKSIDEGYHFIKGHRIIFTPFLLLLSLQIVATVVIVNTPAIALDLIGIDVNSAGLAIIVPVAIGAILSAVTISRFLRRGYRKKAVIEKCFLAISILLCFMVFATPLISDKLISIVFSVFSASLIGAAFVGIIIPSQTYLQEVTPGGLRGRVFGNYGFLVTVLTIFPVIFSGALVDLFGVRLFLLLLGILSLMVFIISRKVGERFLKDEK